MDALGIRHLFSAPNFGGFSSDHCDPAHVEESWRDRAQFVRIAAHKFGRQQTGALARVLRRGWRAPVPKPVPS